VDDQHFKRLHGSSDYTSELKVYRQKHRFRTANVMTVPAPPLGLRGVEGDTLRVHMDSDFHGLGVHINTVRIGDFEAKMIHCTTPIEDEVTEWTLNIYMPSRRSRRWGWDIETFMNLTYPLAPYAQTYFLHTQDRRVFFERAEYRFFEDVPEGYEKVNAFRRWIQEELMGEARPVGAHSIPTRYEPFAAK